MNTQCCPIDFSMSVSEKTQLGEERAPGSAGRRGWRPCAEPFVSVGAIDERGRSVSNMLLPRFSRCELETVERENEIDTVDFFGFRAAQRNRVQDQRQKSIDAPLCSACCVCVCVCVCVSIYTTEMRYSLFPHKTLEIIRHNVFWDIFAPKTPIFLPILFGAK